jgi:hypothetical protein
MNRRIKKHTLRENWHSRKEPIFVVHQILACHRAVIYGGLMSLISLLKEDDNTYQELSDDKSEDPGEFTLALAIKEDNLVHQQEVPLLGKAHRNKSL